MDSGNSTPVQSAPSTPSTPGAPLFAKYRSNNSSERAWYPYGCNSLKADRCKCFPPELWRKAEPFFRRPSVILLCRKVLSEFLGTFIMIFAAAGSSIVNEKTGGKLALLGLAGSAGLVVTIVISSTGHVSGAHINPAVTIAFATFRHFPWTQVPVYIVAQLLGSTCASFALKGIFHPYMHGGVTVPSGANSQAFSLEFIITFVLMFVVLAVSTDKRAVGELAGIVVGCTVTLNNFIAAPYTGASMNPVRSLGPALAAGNFKGIWVYIVAPITGALLGAASYTFLAGNGNPDSEAKQSTATLEDQH